MNRKDECVRVFVGAAAIAYALYALTLPEGLPWGFPETLSSAWMVVALAAGLLGSLVTRYLGWRCGAAVALIFTCVPEGWNRTILGDRRMVFVAFALCGLWLLNAILLWVFRKAREAQQMAPAVTAGAAAAHDETLKRGKVNGIAAWVFLGIAALYATVSILLHDYRIGEPASVFAKGVVEAAGERIIVLNGVCDEQVERELGVENRCRCSISLQRDEAYRTNLVAWVKREWPGETNLHFAAQVSVAAFLEETVEVHPERFYLMNGQSTTLAGWEKRWEAFKPYLKSRDPFVPVARRLFGYEGNAVGNALLDEGEGQKDTAWHLYERIYKEIDPGNASALFNLNEMIRRGYKTSVAARKLVTDRVEAFFRDETLRQHVREIVKIAGPVRADPAVVEQLRQEAERQAKERVASDEKVELSPEVREVFEMNDKMVDAMLKHDSQTAAKIARKILSMPSWRNWAAANAVMGEVMSDEGDYAAAEMFFSRAIANEKDTPDVVMNNYADTLMNLGKLDEAERILRELIAKRGKVVWPACFTLAEVLSRKAKGVGVGVGVGVGEGVGVGVGEGVEQEVRELAAAVMKYAPADMREQLREKQKKGEIIK